jgi:hypothetical protein
MSKTATLIQFNDAYHLDQGRAEPVGGAPRYESDSVLNVAFSPPGSLALTELEYRFGGLIKKYEDRKPLIVCSGDVFSPSLSTSDFGRLFQSM